MFKTLRSRNPLGKNADLITKLYPNGECVVYRQKIKKMKPAARYCDHSSGSWLLVCWRAYLINPQVLLAASLFMGLSLVRNFDNLSKPLKDKVSPIVKRTTRYGQNGISRRGARSVRCAAHLLQKRHGRGRLTFATVTVPPLPMKHMRAVHERWNEVVERYRLGLRRVLKEQGLSGEIVTVSEIQTKREAKTGLPVLHLHSIFCGRLPYGGWAVSPKLHDDLWRKAIRVAIGEVRVSFKSAANLQEVRSSASGYLGKYMSKGASSVQVLKDNGFSGWLPRQWWNCTRTLIQRVHEETIITGDFGEFLSSSGDGECKDVWDFVRHMTIEFAGIKDFWVATYGRLNSVLADEIRSYNKLTMKTRCDTLSSDIKQERRVERNGWVD